MYERGTSNCPEVNTFFNFENEEIITTIKETMARFNFDASKTLPRSRFSPGLFKLSLALHVSVT